MHIILNIIVSVTSYMTQMNQWITICCGMPYIYCDKDITMVIVAGCIEDFLYDTHQYFQWQSHDEVIKWKHFPCYWPFIWGVHQSPVNSPHKGQWCGALMGFFYLCLNKWLSKLSGVWLSVVPLSSLWHHRNVAVTKPNTSCEILLYLWKDI